VVGSLKRNNIGLENNIKINIIYCPHPLLVLWSRKFGAIPAPPYGPYGLYRVSVTYNGVLYLNILLNTSKIWVRINAV